MSDWKQKAIDAYERECEEAELQEAERKTCRIEQAKEKLIAALQERNIPLPADAEIRVDDHEDDAEIGALPYVTIEGIEFTFGPNGTGNHGGGLGIVTTCPRCQQRVRGPYIFAESILGRELLNPERVDHVCQTEEEKADAHAAQQGAHKKVTQFCGLCGKEMVCSGVAETPATLYLNALRDMIREVADERIEATTGAA